MAWAWALPSLHAAMVYLSSWQEYQEAAEALYEKSPVTVSVVLSVNFCRLIARHRRDIA